MQILPVIFFLIFLAIVFANVIGFVKGHGKWTKSFEHIATRYGGWFSSARATRPPAATFKYKDHDVRLKCKRTTMHAPETEFRIRSPVPSMKLDILPLNLQPKRRALRGLPPVPVGDENFDNEFNVIVEANKRELAKRLVNNGVRWQVKQLQHFFQPVSVTVSIEKTWLVIRAQCFVKDQTRLDDYVRFCLELFDQLSLTTTEGIEFREDMVMSAVDECRCPICSSDIDGKMVICIRCKTPHCLDCWQYNVKCGMYACNETRYAIVGGQ